MMRWSRSTRTASLCGPNRSYPVRLLLPDFEGNIQVNWIHRSKLADRPARSREETSHYTEL